MKHFLIYSSCLLIVVIIQIGCKTNEINVATDQEDKLKIAFMPDVHFHDVFAEFENTDFDGLPTKFNGEIMGASIRSMESQLTSTRLFNENYFAFIAALDDAVERGIKIIGLPGDFSDDGQPAHVSRFVSILNQYRDKYGLQFFVAPGNHDPTKPFTHEAGKMNYLGKSGRAQPIFSNNHPYCTDSSDNRINSDSDPQIHEVICTDEVKELGYEGLLGLIGEHGIYPNERYLYYENPFSSYDQNNYVFEQAVEEAGFSSRLYEICYEGSGGEYKKSHYTNCFDVMDMSYVVEPIEDLWLLSIDANVYLPLKDADPNSPVDAANFTGSGNSGYNKVLTHKQHLVEWIKDVVKRADENGKILIAFSHFPAIDFYNQASEKIEQLWGKEQFQLQRIPSDSTSKVLAATGLKLHIAGHMHMNDTGVGEHVHVNDTGSVKDGVTGNTLFNVQVPSLAAYVPSYKILRVQKDNNLIEVETIVMREVPNFDTLFPHYLTEWSYLDSIGYDKIWNRDILHSSNYYEFTDWHIRELSRLRFLPREWPNDVRNLLVGLNGRDMLISSMLESSLSFGEFNRWLSDDDSELKNLTPEISVAWGAAQIKASNFIESFGLKLSDFEEWNGIDLSIDFYRLRNADELALRDIPTNRMQQYSVIAAALAKTEVHFSENNLEQVRFDEVFKKRFKTIFEVLSMFSSGLPSDHFMINTETGEIMNLAEDKPRLKSIN